jgi:hypothetical protein
MANAIIPRATMANQQPRYPDGRFAPVTVQMTPRRRSSTGAARLAGIVQRAAEARPTGQGVVRVEHVDDRPKRVILK